MGLGWVRCTGNPERESGQTVFGATRCPHVNHVGPCCWLRRRKWTWWMFDLLPSSAVVGEPEAGEGVPQPTVFTPYSTSQQLAVHSVGRASISGKLRFVPPHGHGHDHVLLFPSELKLAFMQKSAVASWLGEVQYNTNGMA